MSLYDVGGHDGQVCLVTGRGLGGGEVKRGLNFRRILFSVLCNELHNILSYVNHRLPPYSSKVSTDYSLINHSLYEHIVYKKINENKK